MTGRRSILRLGHVFARSFMWVGLACVPGCAHDVHEMARLAGPAIDLEKARATQSALLSKMSCGSCMAEDAAICAKAQEFAVVAAVSGARIVEDSSSCSHERPPSPNDGHTCGHITALQFDAVVPLSAVKADTADVFREFYKHDYWTPNIPEGVAVLPGGRYVVFATRGGAGKPRARWDIGIACSF
jgi:hypothetical protein